MDDYKGYFHERFNNRLGDFGDVSDRIALRQKLKCNSFKWYLENVFPTLKLPPPVLAKGEIRTFANFGGSNKCLESYVGRRMPKAKIHARPCTELGEVQYWTMSLKGEIKRDDFCVSFDRQHNEVTGVSCNGNESEQKWQYDPSSRVIMHTTGKCLEVVGNTTDVRLGACVVQNPYQQWAFQYYAGEISRHAED